MAKVRIDYVTNSSSSSFICLRINSSLKNAILNENNLPDADSDEIHDRMRENYYYDFNLKGGLVATVGECGIEYVGKDIDENDLANRTLNQLKAELVDTINNHYNTKVSIDSIEFDYGEVYN